MPDPIRLADAVPKGRIAGCFRFMSLDSRDGSAGNSIADAPGENLANNV
jgi:hypothetical protein